MAEVMFTISDGQAGAGGEGKPKRPKTSLSISGAGLLKRAAEREPMPTQRVHCAPGSIPNLLGPSDSPHSTTIPYIGELEELDMGEKRSPVSLLLVVIWI